MRLLLLSSEFRPGPGGIGTHACELARALTDLGWEITVLSPQNFAERSEIDEFNKKQPFKIFNLKTDTKPKIFEIIERFFTVAAYAKKWRPDLAVATGGQAVWLAAVIFSGFNIPWVAIGHGGEFGVKGVLSRALMKFSFRRAWGVVCVSRYTAGKMHEMGIDLPVEEIIPNGADPAQFPRMDEKSKRDFRSKFFPKAEAVLLTVGSVSKRKGQDTVIRALPHIHKYFPQTHYVLAGFPQEKESYLQIAKDLGVDAFVHFMGCVGQEELTALMNVCDMYVLTSRHSPEGDFEGYGISVVEAAFCAKPAVVTRDSRLVEAIAEGETGFSVPQNDEKAAAEMILKLLSDQKLRFKMGEAAMRRAFEFQTWEKQALKYDAFFKKIAAGKRS